MEQRLCLFAQRSASLSINLHWKSTGAQDQPAVCSVFRSSSVCFLEDKPVLTISYLFIFIFSRKCSATILFFPPFLSSSVVSWLHFFSPDEQREQRRLKVSQDRAGLRWYQQRDAIYYVSLCWQSPPRWAQGHWTGLKEHGGTDGGVGHLAAAPTCPSISGRRSCCLTGRVTVGGISQRRLDSTSNVTSWGTSLQRSNFFFFNLKFTESI